MHTNEEDRLGELLSKRLELAEQVTLLNSQVKTAKLGMEAIDIEVAKYLKESKLDSVKKDRHEAGFEEKVGYTVDDWDTVWNYIFESKAAHLLRKQLIQEAVAEMYENGEALPGATLYTYEKLFVRKRG